ncbi:MAG TPA: hypothetical protein VMH03_07075 [Terriglobales bacterium]|nr:hypothetical protein [Terriglobales bacterium]
MKSGAVAYELSLSQILAKGTCPICGVLKQLQSALADKVQLTGM